MHRSIMVLSAAAGAAVVAIAVGGTRSDLPERLWSWLEKPEIDPRGAAPGRPGRYVHHGRLLRRLANPLMVRFGNEAVAVLYVRGRKSGRRLAVPMDPPFVWQGERYLVSPLGDTHWARNVRAAGEADLRIRGLLEHVRAEELGGEARDEVVRAYAATITCGCQEYLAKLPDPADHPVFRLERAGAPG